VSDNEIIGAKKGQIDVILSNKFNNILSLCNIDHLSYCRCQEKEVERYTIIYMNAEKKDLESKNLLDNNSVVNMRKIHARDLAIKKVAEKCIDNDTRCPIEKEEVRQTVELFYKQFDLEDSRVFMVVKAVLSHQLSVYRMQLQSNYKGVLQSITSEEGDITYVLNPVEELKRKFDDSIISAIEKLNRIMYGDKVVNTNINIDALSIAEIIGEAVQEDTKKELIK